MMTTFDPTSVPQGCVYRPVPFLAQRPNIVPRSVFAHTMAARRRSTVESAWNHANAAPNKNTLPHYALGLDEADGCQKFLPTNRRGIANATVKEYEGEHGDISWWSLAIETADTGSDADPGISAFTDYQLEMLTRIYVLECDGWGIPPVKLAAWYGTGCATHTDPFGYPYTTLYRGKICPGAKKKAQFWAEVLPEVQRRLAPAPGPIPTPTPTPTPAPPAPPAPTPITDLEESTMWLIGRTSDTGDRFLASPRPRGGAFHVPSEVPNEYPFKASGGEAFDVGSGTTVTSWGACKKVPQAQLLGVMGAEV